MKAPPLRVALTVLAAVAWLAVEPLAAQDDAAERLEALKAEIASLERELARQIGRRDDGMAELRQIELSIAEARTNLREIGERIDAQQARRDAIDTERREAASQLASEESALAEQLRLSYVTGNRELVKLVLSQESPADFGRMLVYYDYLNRHRSEQIAAVDAELERLARLEQENREVVAGLERLRSEREQALARLEADQAERLALVRELDAAIATSGSRVEQMREEEATLNETIARLERISEGFPVASETPISTRKGELRWPVDGELRAKFGDYRDDSRSLRWDGVILAAEAGSSVRAVYAGRVLVAEWLPGWGLVLIVDHGESIWSVYGHNSALLREAGDWVEAGEAIAEVGESGGQGLPGLYFAIRQDGEPVNPAAWVR